MTLTVAAALASYTAFSDLNDGAKSAARECCRECVASLHHIQRHRKHVRLRRVRLEGIADIGHPL